MRAVALLAILLARGWAAETDRARFEQIEKAAREAFQRRDFARAAENLRQAVLLSPGDARARHELGLAEAAAGNFDRADEALRQAERLAPRDFGILLTHAKVQLSRKQPDLALAAFLRARQNGALDAESLLLLATLENNGGAYADAAGDAASIEADPAAPEALRGAAAAIAGLACKNQGRNEEAVREFERAVRLAPNPTAFLALAEIHETGGRFAQAVQILGRAHAALPGSAKIAISLGRDLNEAGDAARAREVLTRATREAPEDPEGWRWLAEAQNALGEWNAATASLREVARRAPDYPMIHVMLAQALLKQEPVDYDETLRALAEAERNSPSDPDIYYLRGKIFSSQGRYEDAAAALRLAIGLGPSVAASYYQLGLVYQKLGRPAEAAEQFQRFRFLKR